MTSIAKKLYITLVIFQGGGVWAPCYPHPPLDPRMLTYLEEEELEKVELQPVTEEQLQTLVIGAVSVLQLPSLTAYQTVSWPLGFHSLQDSLLSWHFFSKEEEILGI